MGYWRTVQRRAWRETVKAVGLETRERFWVFVTAQLAVAAGIYFALGETGLEHAASGRIAVAATPFLAFPVVYLVKLVKRPVGWRPRPLKRSNGSETNWMPRQNRPRRKSG